MGQRGRRHCSVSNKEQGFGFIFMITQSAASHRKAALMHSTAELMAESPGESAGPQRDHVIDSNL